jgi:hypothetical protein
MKHTIDATLAGAWVDPRRTHLFRRLRALERLTRHAPAEVAARAAREVNGRVRLAVTLAIEPGDLFAMLHPRTLFTGEELAEIERNQRLAATSRSQA